MAEVVGTLANIAAVLQLASALTKYVRAVKNAPSEQKRLVLEITSIRGLVSSLNDSITESEDEDEEWTSTLQLLAEQGSPLYQIQAILQLLIKKFEKHGTPTKAPTLSRVIGSLQWPFKKDEVEGILAALERQKSSLMLAFHNDHFALSKALRADSRTIIDGLKDLSRGVERTQMMIDEGFEVCCDIPVA